MMVSYEVSMGLAALSVILMTGTFDLTQPTRVSTAEFDLAITDSGGTTRTYAGLSTSPTHPRWWGSAVDDPYARVVVDATQFPAGDPRPAAATTPVITISVPVSTDVTRAASTSAASRMLTPFAVTHRLPVARGSAGASDPAALLRP